MNKKMSKYLLIIVTIIFSVVLLLNKDTSLKKNSRFNITQLSNEFVDKYFEEISNANTDEEKENMLIVISDNKVEDTYGAINVIESPNNQYILQYSSKEK